jgi:hypothetical protein
VPRFPILFGYHSNEHLAVVLVISVARPIAEPKLDIHDDVGPADTCDVGRDLEPAQVVIVAS